MDDSVGEVLAQRAALDRGAGAGIAVSIALHGVAATTAIWFAIHQPPRQMVNTLTIRLSPAGGIVAAPAPATPAPAKKLPELRAPQPAIEPVKPQKAPVVPEKNTAPPSPFGKSTKRPSEMAPPPIARPAGGAAGQSAAGDIAIGSSGVTGLEGGDFPYAAYIENMKRLIGTRWYRPEVAAGAATTVYFAINRDGSIRDAKTETASENGGFDRAALRAVLESSPLPPLPFGYSGSFLGVHLTFK